MCLRRPPDSLRTGTERSLSGLFIMCFNELPGLSWRSLLQREEMDAGVCLSGGLRAASSNSTLSPTHSCSRITRVSNENKNDNVKLSEGKWSQE